MKSAIYMDNKKFMETEFDDEKKFERLLIQNSKVLFGSKSIYFDLKNKIETRSLGASIPDAFLFDFRDKDNPEFYIVEVELAKHDFYRHIFPQITKFFAFIKSNTNRDNLIEKLFYFINSNQKIEEEFRNLSGRREIYKSLKDIIENSQNILIVINEDKPEFSEVMTTYTDTWDKMVKIEILKEYTSANRKILSLNPDFKDIEFAEPSFIEEAEDKYTENFHTEGVEENIKAIYGKIKETILEIDKEIEINPQKYYISLRKNKNFSYIQVKRKKLHVTIMLPYGTGRKIIKKHKLVRLSMGVQDFYGAPCFRVTLTNKKHINEIIRAIREAYKQQN